MKNDWSKDPEICPQSKQSVVGAFAGFSLSLGEGRVHV